MKLYAIKMLGGKCSICGYDKCVDALEFHHRNPLEKEFKLGSGNTMSWKDYKNEALKCMLVCSNCHKDFDGGLYSCMEHIKKPGKEIYELIIERYNLNKNQTIFFDNTLRNVNTGNDVGIKSVLFRDINDVIQNLEEEKI